EKLARACGRGRIVRDLRVFGNLLDLIEKVVSTEPADDPPELRFRLGVQRLIFDQKPQRRRMKAESSVYCFDASHLHLRVMFYGSLARRRAVDPGAERLRDPPVGFAVEKRVNDIATVGYEEEQPRARECP